MRVAIPGTNLALSVDVVEETPKVRSWLEACANAIAPEIQATVTMLQAGTLGVAGQRDPESPCAAYQPGKPGTGDCESDGHYLCFTDPGCVKFKAPPPECPKGCDAQACRIGSTLPCPDGKERPRG